MLSAVGMLAQGLVRFLYTVFIKWGFGAAGIVIVGQVNTHIAVAMFASVLVPLAASNAVAKQLARLKGSGQTEQMRDVVAYLGRVTWTAAVLIGIGSTAFVLWREDVPVVAAVLTGLLAIAFSIYTFTRGTLLGLGLLTRATLWDLLASVIAIVGIAALVLARATPWLLVPLVVCYATYALGSYAPLRGGSVPLELRQEIGAFMRISLIQTAATTGFLQGSQIAARHFGTDVTTGHFALALSLATPASLVARSLQVVLFPRMAHAHGRGDHAELARQTDQATRWLVLLCVVVYGTLILGTPTLLQIYGRDAYAAAPTLVILLLACLVQNMVVATTDNLMSREHRYNRIIRNVSVAGAVVGALTWALIGPHLGVEGVAYGYLVGICVTSLIPTAIVWRLDRQRWVGLAVRTGLALAALAAASAWIVTTRAGVLVQVAAVLVLLLGWGAASQRDVRSMLAMRRR
ncbi:hypothetical protein ADJ73_05345 [Arsenicicoccus sp. oral taxon 190]|nr:hypothetical protein ADJ73_05345 [Arsenicicoccus sp. oral taxon 190]